jgi:hypothetical protein
MRKIIWLIVLLLTSIAFFPYRIPDVVPHKWIHVRIPATGMQRGILSDSTEQLTFNKLGWIKKTGIEKWVLNGDGSQTVFGFDPKHPNINSMYAHFYPASRR